MTYEYPFTDTLQPSGTVTRIRDIEPLYNCPDVLPCGECGACPTYAIPFYADDVFWFPVGFRPTLIEAFDLNNNLLGTLNNWIQSIYILQVCI